MGASARLAKDLGLVRGDGFAAACRLAPTHFTRRRKMPHDLLVESVVARKGRTLKIELREFGRCFDMDGPISAPGYLKQREKLNPRALAMLMRHHARQVYADGDAPTWRGMHVLAIDGSTAHVPTTDETVAEYGTTSSSCGRQQATCGLSAVFDVVARQIVGLEIAGCGFDERSFVPGHAAEAAEAAGGEPIVLVLDRGYPSFGLLAWLSDSGIPYLMRAQSNFLSPEFRRAAAEGGDSAVELEFTRERLCKGRGRPSEGLVGRAPVEVRCVLVDIGGAAPERLVTNLPARDFAPEDLKELYHMRWGVETCFQMLKDRLQLENMTGTKPLLIEQDIYASAYLLNVAFDIANEADAAARERGDLGRYKHEMTVDRGFAIGVLKDELIGMVLADDDERDAIMARIVEELSRCLVPVRRDRSYPRKGLKHARSNRYSNTHKRVF